MTNDARMTLGLGLLLVCAAAAGCGGDRGAAQAQVEGAVTLNGTPVDAGTIDFFPSDGGKFRKASAQILQGRYQIPQAKGPNFGKYRVEVHWFRPTGRKVPYLGDVRGPVTDEMLEAVPAKYNQQSVLEVEITSGRNRHDFALLSAGGAKK